MNMTMKELAEQTGVSQSTVSLVVNGKAAGRVSPDKQRRVHEAIKRYGFRPNLFAANLRNRQCRTIGICMPAPTNAGYAAMMLEQQKHLHEKGFQCQFSFWQVPSRGHDILRQELHDAFEIAFAHRVDGIIAWYNYEGLEEENIPTVIFGSEHPRFDSVEWEITRQGEMPVDYLTGLGHRNIAYFGFDGSQAPVVRRALLAHGLPAGPEQFIFRDPDQPINFDRTMPDELFRRSDRPTALICQSEHFAVNAIIHANAAGLRIPQDLSVLSASIASAPPYSEPVTTITADAAEGVEKLVDLLQTRIAHPELPVRAVKLEAKLIDRGTCARPGGK